jgi:large subunit ribosomal protein L29
MASIVELRQMSDDKLAEMLENAREEMFNLRFQHASARLDDVSRLKQVRREIAQLETVVHMRDLAVEVALAEPEIAEAVEGSDWTADVHFNYEESAWAVDFVDSKKRTFVSTLVDLNRKVKRGRRARRME